MSFNSSQFRGMIEYVLKAIGLHSDNAVNLLLLTAAQESHFGTYLKQTKGPALGVFQVEPRTHADIRSWCKHNKPELFNKIHSLCFGVGIETPGRDYDADLAYNLMYAVCIARVYYLRIKDAIPSTTQGQAEYWKKYYNTYLGKGTVEEAIRNYSRFVN